MPPTLLSDPTTGTTARASSTLQRNFKLYGPINALDISNPSSSWNSEGVVDISSSNSPSTASSSSSCWYMIDFHRLVHIHRLTIQFQAGFVASSCQVVYRRPDQITDDTQSITITTTTTSHPEQQQQIWDVLLNEWELDDIHSIQSIDLATSNYHHNPIDFTTSTTTTTRMTMPASSSVKTTTTTSAIKLVFRNFTDFYSRIIIYRLEVWGDECYNVNEKYEKE